MHTSLQLRSFTFALATAGFFGVAAHAASPDPHTNGLAIALPPSGSPEVPNTRIVLAPVQANVSLTTNALLGFVNSQPVFVQDLFRPIDKQLRTIAANSKNIADFRDASRAAITKQMSNYVYQLVLNSAASTALSDQDRGQLDGYLRVQRSELLSKSGGSEALANVALKPVGSSVDKEMDDMRRDLVVRLYMHKQLYPKIVITRGMVMDEYERSAAKHVDAEIELFTITLPLTRWLHEPGTDGKRGPLIANPTSEQVHKAQDEMMATAREIAVKARKGADFAALAEDYSSADTRANYGGYWPKVTHNGSLNPAIENLAFSLPANTVGEPLLLPNNDFKNVYVVVLKVGKKKEARTIPFSEAQADIMKTLQDRQYESLSKEYMQKLTDGAAVEAVDRMTTVAVEVAVTRYATQ